jgi:FAD/FMN-containing dehydrogenase
MPLIPVSSGLHFNGSTLPMQGGVILDLARMDRIIEVDIRNRRARIEPGVRWGQLQDHLKTMDMIAANPLFPHPAQSVVTSCLERQPLIIPKFEYAEPISTVEVVLPNGDLLRTGSAAAPGAPDDTVSDMVCPYGPGLDFYRLFQGAQGTLGVITWMNIKIEYFSSIRKTWFVSADDFFELLAFVHQVQRLMIGNDCFILNRPDMAAIAGSPEYEKTDRTPGNLKKWTAVIQIAGARRRPEERVAYQEEQFQEICREHNLHPMESLTDFGMDDEVFVNYLQAPWLQSKTYWKYRHKGCCHDIAFHSTFEKIGPALKSVNTLLAENDLAEAEYGVYIQPLEYGRAYYGCLHLFFDPSVPSDIEKMRALDEILNRSLLLAGVLFNTPYGKQAELTYGHAAMYTDTLKKVKGIFDPAGILNPGKLCF